MFLHLSLSMPFPRRLRHFFGGGVRGRSANYQQVFYTWMIWVHVFSRDILCIFGSKFTAPHPLFGCTKNILDFWRLYIVVCNLATRKKVNHSLYWSFIYPSHPMVQKYNICIGKSYFAFPLFSFFIFSSFLLLLLLLLFAMKSSSWTASFVGYCVVVIVGACSLGAGR